MRFVYPSLLLIAQKSFHRFARRAPHQFLLKAKTTMQESSSQATPRPSFYRRPLPDSCVAFSSRQGRQQLANAMNTGGLLSFFALLEQHTTQSEPAYCGLSTLVMALNALAIDPLQHWKGPWRWYEEAMVNCCLDLETVQKRGVTLACFVGIAVCQGLSAQVEYAEPEEDASFASFRQAVETACVEKDILDAQTSASCPSGSTSNNNILHRADSTSPVSLKQVLVVSYDRKVLGQTGSGHFSPIAAYDRVTDSVLIADTARFKYGAHWVPMSLLWEAMKPVDPDSGRSRGFVLLQRHDVDDDDRALLVRALTTTGSAYKVLKRYCTTNEACSFQDFYTTFSRSNEKSNLPMIFELLRPQAKPFIEDYARIEQVNSLLSIVSQLSRAEVRLFLDEDSNESSKSCRTTSRWCQSTKCRTVPLLATQAIYLLYLSISKTKSMFLKMIRQSKIDSLDDGQIDEIWTEVSLLRKELLLVDAE